MAPPRLLKDSPEFRQQDDMSGPTPFVDANGRRAGHHVLIFDSWVTSRVEPIDDARGFGQEIDSKVIQHLWR